MDRARRSDETRIFERLADRPRAVGELSELPVSRPAVSQHLRVLKYARSTVGRATAASIRLDPDGVGELRADLDGSGARH